MKKDFDEWNKEKKKLDGHNHNIEFHEREIWWCSIGINIGSEQHSQTSDFSRPVLVIKKFTRGIFWGIPLTKKIKKADFRMHLNVGEIQNDLLVLQMRSYDRKRLIRKIVTVPKEDFINVTNFIKDLI